MAKVLGIVFYFALTTLGWAQELEPKTLGFSDFLEKARMNDVEFSKILNEQKRADFYKELNLPSRALLLDLNSEYTVDSGGGDETSLVGGVISKEFIETGTTLSVSRSEVKAVGRDEKTSEVRLSQSLVKNAFGSQVRVYEDVLEQESKTIDIEVVELYEDYTASLMNQYFDWQLAYSRLQFKNRQLAEAKRFFRNIERRRTQAVARSVEVDRARLQMLSVEQEIISLQTQYEQLSKQIKALAGLDIDVSPIEGELPFSEKAIRYDAIIKKTVDRGRQLQAYQLRTKAAEGRLDIARQNTRPDLNLFVGYYIDDSTRFTTQADREGTLVGLNLLWPFLDNQTKKAVEENRYLVSKAELEQAAFRRDLAVRLENLRLQIESAKKKVELDRQRWQVADRVLNEERRRYKNGSIDLETLIDAENGAAANQDAYFTSRTQLNQSIVEWLSLSDTLVEKI